MKHFITVLLLLLCKMSATAADKTAITGDKDLSRALAALKQADGYAYRITMTTVKDNDDKDTAAAASVMHCYSGQASFTFYAESAGLLQLACSAGSFRCQDNKKEVGYRLFSNDSMLHAAKATFSVNAGALIDSVLLHGAFIRKKKVQKGLMHYWLGYNGGGMVQEMEVVLNAQKDFITSVRYRMLRTLAAGRPAITQEITMSDYQHQPPPQLTAMLAAIQRTGLKAYLQQQYPGYRLRSF